MRVKLSLEHYSANILSTSDFYSFGMQMPERTFVGANAYRYSFGGQEIDNEVHNNRNNYTAEYWQYDSRLGRRWNVDPVVKPWESSYATFSNNPIYYNDPNGLEATDGKGPKGKKGNFHPGKGRSQKGDPKGSKSGKISIRKGEGDHGVELTYHRTFKDRLKNSWKAYFKPLEDNLSNLHNLIPNVMTHGGNERGGRGGKTSEARFNPYSIWKKMLSIDMGILEDIMGTFDIMHQGNATNDSKYGPQKTTDNIQRKDTKIDQTKVEGHGLGDLDENDPVIKVETESTVNQNVQKSTKQIMKKVEYRLYHSPLWGGPTHKPNGEVLSEEGDSVLIMSDDTKLIKKPKK